MNVSDIMTSKVVSIRPEAPILEAVRLMLQNRISGLPVVDAGKVVGIVTEGDLLRRSEIRTERKRPRWIQFLLGPSRLADDYVRSHGRKVAEVMSTEVVTVPAEASLDEVIQLMERHRIKRLPVIRDEQLVGLVSRANLLHALAATAREVAPTIVDDAKIRARLIAEEKKQPWAPPIQTNFVVRNGVVHLWGVITNEQQRQALKVMAENVPGVREVRDHIVWVEPMSGMAIESADDDTGTNGTDATPTVGPSAPKPSAPA
jgi:CBS domain-containing protein